MGASKTDHFSDYQNQIASLCKALGHPARVAIVEFLLHTEHCICGDIVNELPLAQATVSQHLRELKSSGLIQGEVEGNAICYCLNQDYIDILAQFIASLTHSKKLKSCC